MVLSNDKKIYSFGSNYQGQLGLGDYVGKFRPTLIQNLPAIPSQIYSGYYTSMILMNNGQVYAFGDNSDGHLGLGDTKNINIPTLIKDLLVNIIQVSIGFSHTLALTHNGQVYAFGSNFYGQLGFKKDVSNAYIPTLIPNLNNIVKISAGKDHSLVLTDNGQVYAFGLNRYGQLGVGFDYFNFGLVLIPEFNNIVEISAGYKYSLIMTDDGKVYGFGSNKRGRLGLGDYENRDKPTFIMSIYNK